MKNILMTMNSFKSGGTEQGVLDWTRYIDKMKYRIVILGHKIFDDMLALYQQQFETIILLEKGSNYKGIETIIRENGIDLCHVNDGGGYQEHIHLAAKHVPVVQTFKCPRYDNKNYNDVDIIIAESPFTYGLIKGSKGRIIEVPFDLERHFPKHDRAYFGFPEDKLIIGSLGNAHFENDDFTIIANQYKHREDLLFILKTPRKDIPSGNFISMTEYLSLEEKISLMNCFDIFLYPTSFEGFGLVFVEAMAFKVPIISYDDSSAIRDTIGGAGFTVPYRSIEKLKKGLDILLEHPNLCEHYGDVGYLQVKTRFDPKLIARKHEDIYEKLLKS
jgi:glycosyltransferase involved in cell wall biosynthesis